MWITRKLEPHTPVQLANQKPHPIPSDAPARNDASDNRKKDQRTSLRLPTTPTRQFGIRILSSARLRVMMTRRKLIIKKLRQAAKQRGLDFYLLRQGSRHEVYCLDGLRIPIPRHNEVSERTTLDIINESEQKLGKGWWQ